MVSPGQKLITNTSVVALCGPKWASGYHIIGPWENDFYQFKIYFDDDSKRITTGSALRCVYQKIIQTLDQVIVWCHQAPSHYLIHCGPRSKTSYGITRSHWVKCLTWLPLQIWCINFECHNNQRCIKESLLNAKRPQGIISYDNICLQNKYNVQR